MCLFAYLFIRLIFMSDSSRFEKIVSLAKRRGFVFPSSEIYGGLANVYDYGPMGVELIKNLRTLWWKKFVRQREDIVGLESAIFMHPNVWVASGHVGGFSDPMVEDKVTHRRYRADHLIEAWTQERGIEKPETDTFSVDDFNTYITDQGIRSPEGNELTPVKQFNLMFKTQLGSTEGEASDLYLRAETAQGMYVDFKNILASSRKKVPFGVAQQGRVFRNEITTGKFLFRMLEFQQMEIQYFFDGQKWEEQFEAWRTEIESWYIDTLGINKAKFRWKPHAKLIFYAKAAEDIQYEFPWGFDEVSGLHYRTDYDLGTHQQQSGQDLTYTDPITNERYLPHVLETTWGLDRNLFMVLDNAYVEESDRVVLKLPNQLAPFQVAVFPLLKNKPELVGQARHVFDLLKNEFVCDWDDRGNIGKRYYAQDEIGTPFCVTIDFDSLEDHSVTIRNRDTMEQERIAMGNLREYLLENL